MANNLGSNTSSVTLKKIVEHFQDSRLASKTVNTQLIKGEISPDTGDTVFLKRPTQANTISTPDGDLTSKSPDNLIRGKIAALP